MSAPAGIRGAVAAPPTAAPPRDDRAALRKLASQFEGVFMDQLFQAMRQSVPQGGFLEKSAGEDMFTSLLDDKLSELAATRLRHGISEALYRQLSRRLGPPTGTAGEGTRP